MRGTGSTAHAASHRGPALPVHLQELQAGCFDTHVISLGQTVRAMSALDVVWANDEAELRISTHMTQDEGRA